MSESQYRLRATWCLLVFFYLIVGIRSVLNGYIRHDDVIFLCFCCVVDAIHVWIELIWGDL